MQNSFGDAIYRRRKALGLTQEQLAAKVGIQAVYIGYLERGMRHASPRVTGKLAEALGLNPSYLFLASNPSVKEFLNVQEDSYQVEMPLPQSLLDLRADEHLCKLHGITEAEFAALERMSFLGEARSKHDYVFLLELIRRIFSARA